MLSMMVHLTGATAAVRSTPHGVVLPVGQARVELAVASLNSFRVSVSFGGAAPRQLETPMVAPQTAFAKFDNVKVGAYQGIKTAFGSILVSEAGGFKMLDATGAVLTEVGSGFATNTHPQQTYWPAAAAAAAAPTCDPTAKRGDCGMPTGASQSSCEAGGCCWSPVDPNPNDLPWCFHSNGVPTPPPAPTPPTPVPSICASVSPATDVGAATRVGATKATDQNGCCVRCDADPGCETWIFATDGYVDDQGNNCWFMKDVQGLQPRSGRIVGGKLPPTPAPTPAPPVTTLTLGASKTALYYGAGADGQTALSLTTRASSPYINNRAFMTPHYHSTDGYSTLGVSLLTDDQTGDNDHYPAAWTAETSDSAVTWTIAGTEADLYLMPGSSLKHGTSAYYEVTGAPKVLPRHAYGFMACRWGWDHSDRPGESAPDYMKRMLGDFRSGSFPIDSFISDFEWYTDEPDYNLPQAGTATFTDFW